MYLLLGSASGSCSLAAVDPPSHLPSPMHARARKPLKSTKSSHARQVWHGPRKMSRSGPVGFPKSSEVSATEANFYAAGQLTSCFASDAAYGVADIQARCSMACRDRGWRALRSYNHDHPSCGFCTSVHRYAPPSRRLHMRALDCCSRGIEREQI